MGEIIQFPGKHKPLSQADKDRVTLREIHDAAHQLAKTAAMEGIDAWVIENINYLTARLSMLLDDTWTDKADVPAHLLDQLADHLHSDMSTLISEEGDNMPMWLYQNMGYYAARLKVWATPDIQ